MGILSTIKDAIPISLEDTSFDGELLMAINSAASVLTFQIGVGPVTGITITAETDWSEIYTDKRLAMVEEYLYLKTKLKFDPPSNATLLSTIKEEIVNSEWRIGIVVDQLAKEASA